MRHAFVDESFAGPYLVAAAILPAGDVAGARQAVRGLLDRQQRRLHFKDESDQRKRRILETLAELDLQARVYVTTNSRAARKDCLTQLVPDLANAGVTRLVIERDDSLIEFDRRTLYQLVKARPVRTGVSAPARSRRPVAVRGGRRGLVRREGRAVAGTDRALHVNVPDLDARNPAHQSFRLAAGFTSAG